MVDVKPLVSDDAVAGNEVLLELGIGTSDEATLHDRPPSPPSRLDRAISPQPASRYTQLYSESIDSAAAKRPVRPWYASPSAGVAVWLLLICLALLVSLAHPH